MPYGRYIINFLAGVCGLVSCLWMLKKFMANCSIRPCRPRLSVSGMTSRYVQTGARIYTHDAAYALETDRCADGLVPRHIFKRPGCD